MNTTNPTTEPVPPIIEPTPAAPASPSLEAQLRRWLWRLLACNPFYLGSAALLLYSMRCLSLDAAVFKNETGQMFFNVTSFHFYELLLVGTAVFLARRKIWYDSGLLVGLENLFLFVPFILVSQALLLDDRFAFELCLAGTILAGIRVRALKRYIATVNLPARLLIIGAVLLGLNLGLPVLTRMLHKNVTLAIWDGHGTMLERVEWFLIVPLAMGCAWLLPSRATGPKESFFSQRWFPMFALTLWVGGTATHLYCISYVYGMAWRFSFVSPVVWTAAWVLWLRREDLDFVPAKLRRFLLFVPMGVLLAPLWDGHSPMIAAIAGLNAAVYGGMALLKRDRTCFKLSLASAAVALCCVPRPEFTGAHVPMELPSMGWTSFLTFIVLATLFSRNPKRGLLGALAVPFWLGMLIPDLDGNSLFFILQAGLVFLLLHSLRWEDAKHPGAKFLRIASACLWLALSAGWLDYDHAIGLWATFLSSLAVMLIYFFTRLMFGFWGSRVVPYGALAVMALPVLDRALKFLLAAPDGILLLLASFALFAVGTAAALLRGRWHPKQPLPEMVVKQSEAAI